MLDTPVLALIWTFNLSAVLLALRPEAVKKAVVSSWEVVLLIVLAQLAWVGYVLYTGAPFGIALTALWLGLNLMATLAVTRAAPQRLTPFQVVLLCAWWLGLLAMLVRAVRPGADPWI